MKTNVKVEQENEVFILSQDGKEIFRGTEFKCYLKLQRSQGQSAMWAMRYSGWKIEPLNKAI